MAEITDRELARLYYERYRLLMLDQEIGVDPFEELEESEVTAIAGALRHILAQIEHRERTGLPLDVLSALADN
jgi:hypothetical protein